MLFSVLLFVCLINILVYIYLTILVCILLCNVSLKNWSRFLIRIIQEDMRHIIGCESSRDKYMT